MSIFAFKAHIISVRLFRKFCFGMILFDCLNDCLNDCMKFRFFSSVSANELPLLKFFITVGLVVVIFFIPLYVLVTQIYKISFSYRCCCCCYYWKFIKPTFLFWVGFCRCSFILTKVVFKFKVSMEINRNEAAIGK